jgi:hypothetical protein
MGKKKQAPERVCIRCHGTINDQYRAEPWCEECSVVLQGQTYTGEQVLELIIAMMPPTPPNPDQVIRVYKVQEVCRDVMIQVGILLPHKTDRPLPPPDPAAAANREPDVTL